jgi:mannose-6-phosphate isomerase-like protein (cupin superfamily)
LTILFLRRTVIIVKQVDYSIGDPMPVIPAPPTATHDIGTARFTSLATPSRGSTETAVWTVEIPAGAPATPHALTREEIFVVLDGTATVTIDSRSSTAGAGDAIVVPAATRFALANEQDAPLRLLCCMPVGGQGVVDEGAPFTPPWAQ